ncbi:MAG: VOC family protein [Pseudomonadota bacterium]
MPAKLEHVNIAVPDAKATADLLREVFGWRIRWEGASLNGGYSVHVGDEGTYLTLYSPKGGLKPARPRYRDTGSLCHVGLVVDDLEAA